MMDSNKRALTLFAFFILFTSGVCEEQTVGVVGMVKSVHFADFNGDGLKDLLTATAPRKFHEKTMPLQLYPQQKNGSYERIGLPKTLYQGTFFFMLGNFGPSPGQELLLIHDQGVKVLYLDERNKPRLYQDSVALDPLFYGETHEFPRCLNFAADLDGNGFDDALVPIPEGYAALLSNGKGGFEKPVILSIPVEWSIQASANSFLSIMTQASKLHILKKEKPLILLEAGGDLKGFEFHPEKKAFISFKSQDSDFSGFAKQTGQGTIEYSGLFFDPSRDGVLQSTRAGKAGVLSALKTTHTYFNVEVNREEGLIKTTPKQRVVTPGISGPPVFSDLNNDGHKDLVILYVKTSILSKFIEFLKEKVVITCQAHLYDPKNNRFSFEPDWRQDVSIPALSFRVVGLEGLIRLEGDYDGDKRPDMVVYDDDEIVIKKGVKESGWFSSSEVAFKSSGFFKAKGPFSGPLQYENINSDPRLEIINFGENKVRIIYVQ